MFKHPSTFNGSRKHYALELIESILGDDQTLPKGRALALARPFLPYRIDTLDSGRCLPLNRDYKPLGCRGNAWAEYADSTYTALCFDAAELDLSATVNNGFFFHDGTSPLCASTSTERNVYLFRLYWTFRHVGMAWPGIPYVSLATVSKLTGVSVDTMLDEIGGGE